MWPQQKPRLDILLPCFAQAYITSRPFLMSLVLAVVALYLGFLAYLVRLSLRRKEADVLDVCLGEAQEHQGETLKEPLLLHAPGGKDTGT